MLLNYHRRKVQKIVCDQHIHSCDQFMKNFQKLTDKNGPGSVAIIWLYLRRTLVPFNTMGSKKYTKNLKCWPLLISVKSTYNNSITKKIVYAFFTY